MDELEALKKENERLKDENKLLVLFMNRTVGQRHDSLLTLVRQLTSKITGKTVEQLEKEIRGGR